MPNKTDVNRPNVLLITADQWRGDCLGYLQHPFVKTPTLDALAADSVVFSQHYAGAAPCSPGRASLYTGLYQSNHRVISNGTPLDDRFDNLSRAARRAGYQPTLFGYTDISPDPRSRHPNDPELQNYEGILPGFTVEQGLPEDDRPWLSWLRQQGFTDSQLATLHHPPAEPGQVISRQPTAYSAEQTQTAFLNDAFYRWLDEQSSATPWFAHLSYLRPHPPFTLPEPYNQLYHPDELTDFVRHASPQHEQSVHAFIAAFQQQQKLSSFIPGGKGLVSELSTEDFARIRALYYGAMSEVDTQIGYLIDRLKVAGVWDNTILIFTSDHAEMMGDHWMLGKGGFYPQSYHIPLMIHCPTSLGAQTGKHVTAPTSATDILPTVLDLLGIAPSTSLDGQSLRPWLTGEQSPESWRTAAVWEFDYRWFSNHMTSREHHFTCQRQGDSLYIHAGNGAHLLFDLQHDPACQHNLINSSDHLARQLQHAESLLQWRQQHNDQTLAQHRVWDFYQANASRHQ